MQNSAHDLAYNKSKGINAAKSQNGQLCDTGEIKMYDTELENIILYGVEDVYREIVENVLPVDRYYVRMERSPKSMFSEDCSGAVVNPWKLEKKTLEELFWHLSCFQPSDSQFIFTRSLPIPRGLQMNCFVAEGQKELYDALHQCFLMRRLPEERKRQYLVACVGSTCYPAWRELRANTAGVASTAIKGYGRMAESRFLAIPSEPNIALARLWEEMKAREYVAMLVDANDAMSVRTAAAIGDVAREIDIVSIAVLASFRQKTNSGHLQERQARRLLERKADVVFDVSDCVPASDGEFAACHLLRAIGDIVELPGYKLPAVELRDFMQEPGKAFFGYGIAENAEDTVSKALAMLQKNKHLGRVERLLFSVEIPDDTMFFRETCGALYTVTQTVKESVGKQVEILTAVPTNHTMSKQYQALLIGK